MTLKKEPVKVLFDTGSPTSFVRNDIAAKLGLSVRPAPPFRFKGIASQEAALTTEAARITLKQGQLVIGTPVYVTSHMVQDVIIGYPIITSIPEIAVLLKKHNSSENINSCCPVYSINVVNMDTAEDNFSSPDIDEMFVINVVEKNKENSLNKLPRWLQDKFSDTVRNDLPPREKGYESPVYHEIDLKPDAKLPHSQPYNTSLKLEEEIAHIVEDLIKHGFVTPSKSPCSSPVILVKKKDNTYRLCVDYRALNKVTVKDTFQLLSIENFIVKICNASFFSMLGLYSGYHQIL